VQFCRALHRGDAIPGLRLLGNWAGTTPTRDGNERSGFCSMPLRDAHLTLRSSLILATGIGRFSDLNLGIRTGLK
jgi:hypothetical protein